MSSCCYRGTLSCLCLQYMLTRYVYSLAWGSVRLMFLCIIDHIRLSFFWSPYVPFHHSLYLYVDSDCCRRFLLCRLYFSVSFRCLRMHRYIEISMFWTFHISLVSPPPPSNKLDILNLNNWVSVLNRRTVRLPIPHQFCYILVELLKQKKYYTPMTNTEI
jgi:hypothetical protein